MLALMFYRDVKSFAPFLRFSGVTKHIIQDSN